MGMEDRHTEPACSNTAPVFMAPSPIAIFAIFTGGSLNPKYVFVM